MRKLSWLLLAGFVFAAFAGAQTVPIPPIEPGSDAWLIRSNWYWAGQQILTLLFPALILFSGFGARLRSAAAAISRGNWYATVTMTAILFFIIYAALLLPYDFWKRSANMGMMAPPLAGWWIGEGVSLLTRCAAAALFVWVPYALIARSPQRWWLYAGAIAIPVCFLTLIALPVLVDPLITPYHALTDKKLYTEIETLAARCGVSHIPVFVGGNDTTVVGLGPTNRIFLGQDLIGKNKPDALLFTVGHELKHYVMGDNYISIVVICVALLLGFFLTHILGKALIARFHKRIGFDDLSDPASVPLGVLILTLSWLCVLPLFNWYARHIEFEADRFALELTHENRGLAQLELDYIAMGDVPDWGPFFRIFRATHPTDGERIRFANSYKPWEGGEPLVYGDVCKRAQR